jgi:hypothetical protein
MSRPLSSSGSSPRVALVTCQVLPEPDPDQELLLDALRNAGADAHLLPWDGADAEPPGAFDLCVLRSCWNYPRAPEAFLAWCERAASESRLANPLPAVRWNLHKGYLRELEEAGVPTVPTAWVAKGETADLGEILERHGWDEAVVKPAVSAASLHTRRFGRGELEGGGKFLADLAAVRDVMVQRFMPAVEGPGERALVWIDGELTHAVRKSPRFSGDDETVTEEAVPIEPAERELAEAAVAHVLERVLGPGLDSGKDRLLYARIDVVDDEGSPRLCELELMEPSLFLLQDRRALERLVEATLPWPLTSPRCRPSRRATDRAPSADRRPR